MVAQLLLPSDGPTIRSPPSGETLLSEKRSILKLLKICGQPLNPTLQHILLELIHANHISPTAHRHLNSLSQSLSTSLGSHSTLAAIPLSTLVASICLESGTDGLLLGTRRLLNAWN